MTRPPSPRIRPTSNDTDSSHPGPLGLVAQGLSGNEAAAQLGLTGHTVYRHVTNILTKTGLLSRAAPASRAARQGLL